ncbi:MAG: MmgE/PrpD family protein [Pseudomonadales bacterium]
MGPTLALAQRVAGTEFDQIPASAREVAKQALLDFIGVTLAGVDEPLSGILRDQVRDEGGHPQAQLIGTQARSSASQAALVNGATGHAHDYDDVHTAMNGHPTVPVAPGVFALSEHLARTGKELISAFCAGVDTECILGRYAGPAHYARGWHATGTLGSFGAAAAAAYLHRLSADDTAGALGIAGTQAAGLKAQFGTMCKPLHAGNAAATGVRAAALASRGFESRDDILETRQGFMATQADSASEQRFEQALEQTAYCQDICFKYHAACYLTHGSIEATSNLCASNAFNPADIDTVEIRVNAGHFDVCNIADPRSGLQAKFSLRFTAAMALAGLDTSSIAIFTDELTRDPELVSLRDKIQIVAHEQPNPDSIVTISTRAGAQFTDAVNVAIPMRDLDAQWVKLEHKFHTLADHLVGQTQADRLVGCVKTLEQRDDLGEFFNLLRLAA